MTDYQCDHCKHGGYYTVHLDDIGSTQEDFSCDKWGVMTDEDAELSNQNKCPYYEAREE